MGLTMPQSESPPASSPPEDNDVHLPDAPPLKPGQEVDSQSTTTNGETKGTKSTVNLDSLFDADSSDEDALNSSALVASSSPPESSSSHNPSSSLPPPAAAAGPAAAKYTDPQIMAQFYSRLFPFRTLFQWLNHSLKPSPSFSNREFAFTLSNDAYLRYQSYPTADLLRKDILRLVPSRFEIGPVYTANPRDRKTLRKSTAFRPIEKEVVFDIDLTDYDDIRTCCDKANICLKCWTFVTMSIKVVDAALREDFGFEHIMWVYSGRRGAHAWISDKAAREMDDEKRKALAGYLEVIKGGAQGGKRVNVKRPLHPHLARSLDVLKPYFQSAILEDQDPFEGDKGAGRLLDLLPDPGLVGALRKKWDAAPNRSSARKWADIDALAATGVSKTLDTKKLQEAKQDILLEYTYPRLDVEVSKKRIHLLKSPFVVHPGTGRVCVPITGNAALSPSEVENFDPLSVPTVTELLAQIDAYKSEGAGSDADIMDGFVADGPSKVRKLLDWEKTDLKGYVERFEVFVKGVLRAEVRGKRGRDEADGNGMEF
jgi:DNA primase small subunit